MGVRPCLKFRLKVIYTAVSNDYMLGRINEIHRVHTKSIYITSVTM